MSNALTVLNNSNQIINSNHPTQAQTTGGLGIDYSSKFFNLKPATVSVVQKNTTTEGAIPGKLRISTTGDQFDEMFVTLLKMPEEMRQYHIGNTADLNRTPENLMCFSRDMSRPDKDSKVPQAMQCFGCSKNDWNKWKEGDKSRGLAAKSKELIPPCDSSYKAVLIDAIYRMPIQMYLRSKNRQPFERGMEEIARTILMNKAQGNDPNIFDVRFRLTTKLITTGKFSSYVINISDPKIVSDEEREAFGDVYKRFVSAANKAFEQEAYDSADEDTDNVVNTSSTSIDNVIDADFGEDIPF